MFSNLKTVADIRKFWVVSFVVGCMLSAFFGSDPFTFGKLVFFALIYFALYQFHLFWAKKVGELEIKEEAEQLKESDAYIKQKHAEELQKRIKEGTLDEVGDEKELQAMLDAAGLAPLSIFHDHSETIIGRFMDEDIFEWIELRNPFSGDIERFTFYAGLESGNPEKIPEIEGVTLALLGHVIYEKI